MRDAEEHQTRTLGPPCRAFPADNTVLTYASCRAYLLAHTVRMPCTPCAGHMLRRLYLKRPHLQSKLAYMRSSHIDLIVRHQVRLRCK